MLPMILCQAGIVFHLILFVYAWFTSTIYLLFFYLEEFCTIFPQATSYLHEVSVIRNEKFCVMDTSFSYHPTNHGPGMLNLIQTVVCIAFLHRCPVSKENTKRKKCSVHYSLDKCIIQKSVPL